MLDMRHKQPGKQTDKMKTVTIISSRLLTDRIDYSRASPVWKGGNKKQVCRFPAVYLHETGNRSKLISS